MLTGPRVPRKYFITSGVGESDTQIHAGSLDRALKDAGIENCNLMFYTSILPKDAEEINRSEVSLDFGSVLECIAAISHARQGERACAGLILGWVFNKKSGERLGGLVAEYHGKAEEDEARKILQRSLKEMFESRFDPEEYILKDVKCVIRSIVPKKKFGSAVVALCFVTYEVPTLRKRKIFSWSRRSLL